MSSIKGGGRAKLSEENQHAIIDLLRDLRDPKDPLLPRKRARGEGAAADSSGDTEKDLSEHDLKKERRRFLKKLVERHERVALGKRLNAASAGSASAAIAAPQDASLAEAADMSHQMQSLALDVDAKAPQAGDSVGGSEVSDKVRIVLVEAIYSSDKGKSSSKDKDKKKDSKSKDDKKSKKSSKKDKAASCPWKEGSTRKTMVLKRSDPVKELLKQAKSKLNMKKKAVRCFYVDNKSKLEIDLETNLAGLEDGAVVYVTSHVAETSAEKKKKKKDDKQCEDDAADQEDEAIDMPDPLEPVKRAYAERKMRRSMRRSQRGKGVDALKGQRSRGSSVEHPVFADHFDKLEELPPARAELPAASYRTKILSALDSSRVVVICGQTGCGKSTQIPQTILEGMAAAGRGDDTHIIVTQPRRVAAMSLAERVASERNSPAPGSDGSVVGYNVRLARRVSDDAKIVYCTVGILLRMLVNPSGIDESELCPSDGQNGKGDSEVTAAGAPLLHVSHLVIDEVHERDLNTDFALTILRNVLARNKHIRIILMSATANPDLFVQYFRSATLAVDPIVLSIPGRTFPVTNNWLGDCEKFAGARLQGWSSTIDDEPQGPRRGFKSIKTTDETPVELSPRATSRIDNAFICKLIGAIVREQRETGELNQSNAAGKRENGAILVFLPGKGEIDALARVLADDSILGDGKLCNILKLHSTVPPAQQRFVFQRAKVGTVKIVLSTNVAETSVTIPDASSVIDTGRVKESRFNSSTRIKELVTVWTSLASATQRAGRAGRTGPGVCWKLYTEQFCNEHLPMQTSPEIVRTPLDELVLQCCLLEENMPRRPGELGTRPIKFLRQAPEPPPTRSLLDACDHLLEVGGLEVIAREPELVFQLTPLGFHLSHLPTDAKVAKCLITGCVLECVEPSLTIAACLSHSKSIWLPSRVIGKEGREMQQKLVEEGFGGKNWRGGTVKGDLIGAVAAYNKWSSQSKDKDRRKIASKHALDNNVLREVHSLRSQFRDSLTDAGFLGTSDSWDGCHDDALFTSCCLVAGLYPNISTLMRPRRGRGNARGGRLITKDGDVCKASSSSFQCDRLWNAKEEGQDAYAVYHAKHRTIGVDTKPNAAGGQADIYLNEVNFVSRYALLLFAGNVELRDTAIIMDGWLKFKIGEKGSKSGAILILELRKELDNVMTKHIESSGDDDTNDSEAIRAQCQRVLEIVRKLLQDEAG